jgi:hypothetical protein
MYKVYFEDSFFEWLDDFIFSMKNYYFNFYSNTWIYDEYKIRQWYFDKYEDLKTELLININNIWKEWVLWRKISYSSDNIEHISFNFNCCNYNIYFTAIKNDNRNEIIISTIKIDN